MVSRAPGADGSRRPVAAVRRGSARTATRARRAVLDGGTYLLVGILAVIALFPFYQGVQVHIEDESKSQNENSEII